MRTVILMLCGMMLATALYAAEQAPAKTPVPDVSEEQTAEEMLAAEAALEAQQAAEEADTSAAATDAAGAEAGKPAPGIADDDFVPSIQISEDLSVSFPVDI